MHDILAWVLRTVGVRGWDVSAIPAGVRVWPAVFGLAFFVWLELVPAVSAATLTVVLVGYTVLTLALMAQFGRDEWRAQGETFTVWFRTLNRMAPFGVVASRASRRRATGASDDGTDDGTELPGGIAVAHAHVERRSFASGLLRGRWSPAVVALIAVGVASIIFDGFSQTVVFASLFGAPGLVPRTLLLVAWLAIVVGAALWVGRAVSIGAIGAGLLPIAIGYLVAHYLTYLLIDGQRIVIAISDPLQQGSDLFGTAFFQPGASWLPRGPRVDAPAGGGRRRPHGGRVGRARDRAAGHGPALASSRPPRDMRHRKLPWTPAPNRNVRMREIPLAVVMVALTTITLWSLGQAIVVETAAGGRVAVASREPLVSARAPTP